MSIDATRNNTHSIFEKAVAPSVLRLRHRFFHSQASFQSASLRQDSAQIMPDNHINTIMSKRPAHPLGRVTIIVSRFEPALRRWQASAWRIVLIKCLGILTAVAVYIQMLRNPREDQCLWIAARK